MFQRRHYEAIARTIQKITDPVVNMDVSYDLAHMFWHDNPRFDIERFRKACIPGADVSARPKKPKAPRVKKQTPHTDYLNAVSK